MFSILLQSGYKTLLCNYNNLVMVGKLVSKMEDGTRTIGQELHRAKAQSRTPATPSQKIPLLSPKALEPPRATGRTPQNLN